RHPLFFYTRCDRQYPPGALPRLLEEIDKVHLVSGYRKWQPVPRWLSVLGRIYRTVLRVLFGLPLEPLPGWLGWRQHAYGCGARVFYGVRMHDVNCLFRLMRRSIFTRLPLQSDGPFVHVEILAKANFLGYYMNDEIHLAYRPRHEVDPHGRILADALRVFRQPDFGPAVPPAASQGAAAGS